jgi:hypothetical protein
MLPVLGGEVVERQQCVAILDQALDRRVVLDTPAFEEGVERREGILLGLGRPDLLQRPLGFRLLALRPRVCLEASRWPIEFPSSVAGDQLKSLFNSSLRASFPARLAAAVVSK